MTTNQDKRLADRGYGYGSGILSPTHDRFVVNIPKNASSYLLDWGYHHGWTAAEINNIDYPHTLQEVIVVLRDPMQRWISGIAQYLTGYVLNVSGAYDWSTGPGPNDQQISADTFIEEYNQIVERLLFDNLNRFDDHVWPQCDFFQDLLVHIPKKFFYIDQNFDSNVSDYLGFLPIAGLDCNHGDANPDIRKIQQFIRGRLNTRLELQERVHRAYAQDYKIIKQVFNQ
jgi:hypothetical protein